MIMIPVYTNTFFQNLKNSVYLFLRNPMKTIVALLGKPAAMLISYGKQFPGKVLDHQAGHKVLGGILFRENQKDSALFPHKLLRINYNKLRKLKRA